MSAPGNYARPVWFAVALGVAAAFAGAAYISGGQHDTYLAGALLAGAVLLYATGLVPGHIASIFVFVGAAASSLAPLRVILSGFASGGVLLLLSGIVMSAAARETGLGQLIAAKLLSRTRVDYPRAIVLLTTVAMLLGFLVPAAIPRIILLLPLVSGVAAALGLEPGSRGYNGLALAVAAGSFYPPLSIMTATLPGVIYAGAIEAAFGKGPLYADFLFYHFPVAGLLRWAGLNMLLILVFREAGAMALHSADPAPRLQSSQYRLMAILLSTVLLWATDFIHHVPPAWVGLGACALILAPGVGVLQPLPFVRKADFTPIVYAAGIISLGAIAAYGELGVGLGAAAVSLLSFTVQPSFWNYVQIASVGGVFCLAFTIPAAPVMLVPIAERLSATSGVPLDATLMIEYLGLTNILLPYQAPPLVIAAALFGIAPRPLMSVTLILFALTTLIVLPLTYLWWRQIGLLP